MMKTQRNSFLQFFYFQAVLLLFFFGMTSVTSNAQTFLDAQPRRVTTGSVVTVTGTGFYPGLEETLRFQPGGFNITRAGNREYVSPTVMTFTIEQTDLTDRTGELRFGPSDAPTGVWMDYIAPIRKVHKVGDPNDVDFRVDEIYTDFSDVLEFKSGEAFDIGDSYSATEFGRWEFYGLVFDADPEGVLVEAGGQGRGMFIGFNDAGHFVARGGDGRPGEGAFPDGCAKVEFYPGNPDPLYDYDFAGKSGNLVVTMNPSNGQLTFEFDEFGDGSIQISRTVTAVINRLGYAGFTEWSGGDSGFVGTSTGNVAGAEITNDYDFNGSLDGLLFTNTTENVIAWRSNSGTYPNDPTVPSNPILPDNNHDLLGFKYNNRIYSTGANDQLLEFYLGSEVDNSPAGEYLPQTFKAYSTNGVQNRTVSQHHIFTGDMLDGKYDETPTEFLTSTDPNFDNVRGLSMFEVLYDGKNGLNIGTGINNLNQTTTIKFFSGNGQFGAVADGIPDLLIPNMAEAGGTDVYYFSDELGNVIGRPIRLTIDNGDTSNPPLSHWINDQYRVDLGESFEDAKPSRRIYGEKQERPMRLIAFELDDFGITGEPTLDSSNEFTNIQSIFSINAGAGGTADIPFLAYNGDTFEIKSPVITDRPVPRSVCEANGLADAIFEVLATVDGGFTGPNGTPATGEALTYQWFQYNNSLSDGSEVSGTTTNELTINNIDANDLGLYRLKVSNTFGTTIVSVSIEEGGTRVTWNGTTWVYPPNSSGGTLSVADADRKMLITADIEVGSTDILEGCSCEIFPGNEMIVRSNGTLKLFDELNLKQADTTFLPGGGIDFIAPAGRLHLEDDASLVQTKAVEFNQNFGDITMDRRVSNLNDLDYIFWSSPVDEFDLSDIDNSRSFLWDVRGSNTVPGTDGNWVAYDGQMTLGRGYIARVPSASPFTTTFDGVPNNGLITYNVIQSVGSQGLEDKHWNLIGNPYPSAISADKFLTHSANDRLEGTLYIWDQTIQFDPNTANPSEAPFYANFVYNYVDAFRSYNAFGTVPAPGVGTFNGNIAAGQGFFVKVRDDNDITGGDIEFRNLMRVGYSKEVLDNSGFYRNNEGAFNPKDLEKEKLWLSLVNENLQSSSLLIGYSEGASDGKDRLFDAYANRGDNELSLHSMLEDGEMVIQAKSLPFNEDDYFKLGINIPQNGIYKIGIDHLKGSLFENKDRNIILEDTYLGVLHDLREKPYSFTGQVGKFNERFILRYTANQLSTTEVDGPNTFVFIKDKILNAQSSKGIAEIKVYDISGKQVISLKPEGNQTSIQTDFNFSRGVYIAIITLDDNISFSKKLIN